MLQTVQKYNNETISEEERQAIETALKASNINSFVNKKKHIRNLKECYQVSEQPKEDTAVAQEVQTAEQKQIPKLSALQRNY